MSRSKELNRIEQAVSSGDPEELQWARNYAEMRRDLSDVKDHQKFWRSLLKQLYIRIAEIQDDE